MNLGKRIISLAIYEVASCLAMYYYVGGGGKGPKQSFPILASWSADVFSRMQGSESSVPVFLIIFALYLLGILLLNNVLRKIVRVPVPIIPLAIHGLGVWIGLRDLGKQEFSGYAPSALLLSAWVVPLIMVLIYFTIEWRLARRSAAGRKNLREGVSG